MYRKTLNCHGKQLPGFAIRGKAASSIVCAGTLAAILLATAGAMPAPSARAAGGASQWNHIAAGGYQTCGIRLGNTLWCWGDNSYGQLGIGTTTSHTQPQQITRPATAGWAGVTAGGLHACATRKDGTLWCWGGNGSGELGIGTWTSQSRPQQVTTPAPAGWTSVTASAFHTCATRSDTTLWCWGLNLAGELGIGTQTEQDQPQQVTTPAAAGWTSVTTGDEHTCATRSDGTLWCWGDNGFGALGIGNLTSQDWPQQVSTPAPTGWTSVTAGEGHTCATRSDATLWCWGWNDAGQLGIGSKTEQDQPQQVTTPAPAGWTSVIAGDQHTCATRTHDLWCWGFNRYGQLGIGSNINQARPRHVVVPAGTGWSLMALGSLHTCATRTGHALWCWGYNHNGQLGIGNWTDQNLPQQVTS
jgi:alpha-tubulin suppressor-like RCC1 family protein